MTYEEADREAREIIKTNKEDGEKWDYSTWGRKSVHHIPGFFFGVVSLLYPVHPKTGHRANYRFGIEDDRLNVMDSIAPHVIEAIATIRMKMKEANKIK